MSNEIIFTIVIGISLSLVVILWVSGIDYMKNNHPDYKGEDFFNEEEDEEI
jgi:hypothetical protein